MKDSQKKNYSAVWDSFIAHGSHEALSLIYFDHYDKLFYFGLKYTSSRQVIEDAIQNTFTYFLKARNKLGRVNNVPAYLLISFRRQLFLDLKNQKKLPVSEVPENSFHYFSNPEQDSFDMEDEFNLRKTVAKCINNLPPKQQEIIYLKFNCDFSYEDIAEIMAITIESCYKSVYRAIKEIRERAQKNSIPEKIPHHKIMDVG